MSCPRHLQHFKPKSINKYHKLYVLCCLLGREVTFLCSFPLPGSLMGCDNPLRGAWEAGDGVRVTRGKRLIPHPQYHDTKNKHVSHRECLAVPLSSPWRVCQCCSAQLIPWAASEHLSHQGPGCGWMVLHGREHRGAMEHHQVLLLEFQGPAHLQQTAPPGARLRSRDLASSQISAAVRTGRVGSVEHTWHRWAELCWMKGAAAAQSRGRQAAGLAQGGAGHSWAWPGMYQEWWKQWKRGSVPMGPGPCRTHPSSCEQTQPGPVVLLGLAVQSNTSP